ncbi:MAG: hypothetical protein HKP61_03305 [Dactylosporangium sp.]|nr:hypothetical protein [Dactylosporangium sp.]NNJ59981.1 hypothetical protein [Dactylosporangium sp.]
MSRYPLVRSRVAAHVVDPGAAPDLALADGGGGLMIGRNRHGTPVLLHALRQEPTRIAFFGGLACAQLLVFRMIALGARVVVQTLRPAEWTAFAQRIGLGPGALLFAQPGERIPPAGSVARAEVVVADVGPIGWSLLDPAVAWRTTFVVRGEVMVGDEELLGGADAVLLQPLTAEEATVTVRALGTSQAESWLVRISPALITIVSRRVARWAALSPTDLELRTIGPPVRHT